MAMNAFGFCSSFLSSTIGEGTPRDPDTGSGVCAGEAHWALGVFSAACGQAS